MALAVLTNKQAHVHQLLVYHSHSGLSNME